MSPDIVKRVDDDEGGEGFIKCRFVVPHGAKVSGDAFLFKEAYALVEQGFFEPEGVEDLGYEPLGGGEDCFHFLVRLKTFWRKIGASRGVSFDAG